MGLQYLTPREVRLQVREPFSWIRVLPQRVFLQEYKPPVDAGTKYMYYPNVSKPAELAKAIRRVIKKMPVRKLLAVIYEQSEIINLGDKNLHIAKWNWTLIEQKLSKKYKQQFMPLCREAKVPKRAQGGILATDEDCDRTAEILAKSAFDAWTDLLLVPLGFPLAIKVCHEADFHVYSWDESMRDMCCEHMKQAGLLESPGTTHRMLSKEEEKHAKVIRRQLEELDKKANK
jgi:hypothetical protein